MKVGSKDAADSAASFALLFVKNYAILDLSDKISAGGWWIPKCCFFTALKSDNAHTSYVQNHWFQCPSGLSVICPQKILLTECLEGREEKNSHISGGRIIFPNSDFWSALTEHEWNRIQLLIWIVVMVMVIDYCHGYTNAWMYGSCSTSSCSRLILILIQSKESEQFQYFTIKWNSGLQSNLFNSCRVPKKMVMDYCVCSTSSNILYLVK